MKTKIGSLVVVFSLLVSVNPLHAEWETVGDFSGSVQALLFNGTDLFAGTWFPGVFLSTDDGTTWTEMNNGLQSTDVFALALNGGYLFAGTNGGGVFRSSDNGTSWTAVNAGLTVWEVIALAVDGANLYAGTWAGGVFRSTDDGIQWTAANTGLPVNSVVQALAVHGDNLYAGTGGPDPRGAFLSTNDGASWTAVNSGLTNPDVRAFGVMGSSLYAGTGRQGGVFVTTDGGASWTEVTNDLASPAVFSFAAIGTVLFAGTSGGGVYHSTNGGGNWIEDGPPPYDVNCLAFNATYLFAGAYQGAVLRRPLSEMTTSVEQLAGGSPRDFSLAQNYPNPFNPTTAIRFAIPVSGPATLKVYEVGGREIATLVDGMLAPGVYQATWNAGNRPNGVYVYRLQTAEFTESRRMLVLK